MILSTAVFALSGVHAESTPEVIRAKAPGGELEKIPANPGDGNADNLPDLTKANLKLRVDEKITYDIRVNGMPAGKASMEVAKQETMDPNGGPEVWVVQLTIKANRAVSMFYDVRNKATSKIDVLGGFSRFSHIDKKDGEIRDEEFVHYDYDLKNMNANYERMRLSDGKLRSHTIALKGNVLDPLSAIYYLRSLDWSKYKAKDKIELPVCTDRRVWNTRLEVTGRGRDDFGDLKNRPYVTIKADPPYKGLFEKKSGMVVSIDAETGIPLRMNVEIPIGSAEVIISEHRNSPYPGDDDDKKD